MAFIKMLWLCTVSQNYNSIRGSRELNLPFYISKDEKVVIKGAENSTNSSANLERIPGRYLSQMLVHVFLKLESDFFVCGDRSQSRKLNCK